MAMQSTTMKAMIIKMTMKIKIAETKITTANEKMGTKIKVGIKLTMAMEATRN